MDQRTICGSNRGFKYLEDGDLKTCLRLMWEYQQQMGAYDQCVCNVQYFYNLMRKSSILQETETEFRVLPVVCAYTEICVVDCTIVHHFCGHLVIQLEDCMEFIDPSIDMHKKEFLYNKRVMCVKDLGSLWHIFPSIGLDERRKIVKEWIELSEYADNIMDKESDQFVLPDVKFFIAQAAYIELKQTAANSSGREITKVKH